MSCAIYMTWKTIRGRNMTVSSTWSIILNGKTTLFLIRFEASKYTSLAVSFAIKQCKKWDKCIFFNVTSNQSPCQAHPLWSKPFRKNYVISLYWWCSTWMSPVGWCNRCNWCLGQYVWPERQSVVNICQPFHVEHHLKWANPYVVIINACSTQNETFESMLPSQGMRYSPHTYFSKEYMSDLAFSAHEELK